MYYLYFTLLDSEEHLAQNQGQHTATFAYNFTKEKTCDRFSFLFCHSNYLNANLLSTQSSVWLPAISTSQLSLQSEDVLSKRLQLAVGQLAIWTDAQCDYCLTAHLSHIALGYASVWPALVRFIVKQP